MKIKFVITVCIHFRHKLEHFTHDILFNTAIEMAMDNTDAVVERMTALLAEWGVNTVKQELVKINDKLSKVQNEQGELRRTIGITQKDCDDTKASVQMLVEENKKLLGQVEFSENKIAHLESSLEMCMHKMLDNQARNMSEDIIFHNIREETRENTREVLISFVRIHSLWEGWIRMTT